MVKTRGFFSEAIFARQECKVLSTLDDHNYVGYLLQQKCCQSQHFFWPFLAREDGVIIVRLTFMTFTCAAAAAAAAACAALRVDPLISCFMLKTSCCFYCASSVCLKPYFFASSRLCHCFTFLRLEGGTRPRLRKIIYRD